MDAKLQDLSGLHTRLDSEFDQDFELPPPEVPLPMPVPVPATMHQAHPSEGTGNAGNVAPHTQHHNTTVPIPPHVSPEGAYQAAAPLPTWQACTHPALSTVAGLSMHIPMHCCTQPNVSRTGKGSRKRQPNVSRTGKGIRKRGCPIGNKNAQKAVRRCRQCLGHGNLINAPKCKGRGGKKYYLECLSSSAI